MIRFTRILKNAILYNYLYPQAHIAPSAIIASDTVIGTGVKVGENASVYRTIIHDNAVIKANNIISNCVIGVNVAIDSFCSINKSKIGDNSFIYENNILLDTTIGEYTYITKKSQIAMSTIGKFCSIGPYLICGYGDHPSDFVSTSPMFYSTGRQCGISFTDKDIFDERKQILVGHDVWIGARVFVRNGVKIGNGAIIGAGSVVIHDVPDYAIVGGVAAKIIRYRYPEDIIKKMMDLEWWNWPEEKLRKAQPYIAQNEIKAFLDWADK